MFSRSSACVTVSAALLALALVGCDTNPPTARNDYVAPGEYPRVVVQGDLNDDVVRGTAIVTPVTDLKPMSVQQPVRNTDDSSINAQYRFEFYDSMHRQLNTSEDWKFIKLPPGVEMNLQGAAMDTNAVEWRLIIRKAK